MDKLIKFNSTSNLTAFGQFGFSELVSGVAIVAVDRFAVLQAIGDTVFAFDNEVDSGLTTSSSFTMLDGDVLYGFFKNIAVASGKLRVYHAKN